MTTYDEAGWREATEWPADDALPSYPEIWEILNARQVSGWFRDRLPDNIRGSPALAAALSQYLDETARDDALDEFRETTAWNLRDSTFDRLLDDSPERCQWKLAFTNLVSGRFTELVFARAYSAHLARVGLRLEDATTERSFRDYVLEAVDPDEPFSLSTNVKNAGRQMRQAEQFFGLEPEDTLPIATYKSFGSEGAGIGHLLYVFLVDWTLLERLRRAYWTRALSSHERVAFRVLTSFRGFSRNLEDAFLNATINQRLPQLLSGVGYQRRRRFPFRVVSAARCCSIFYLNRRRSPYVYLTRMKTDPNVHISVEEETISFDDLITRHLSSARQRSALIAGLDQTVSMRIPDPIL